MFWPPFFSGHKLIKLAVIQKNFAPQIFYMFLRSSYLKQQHTFFYKRAAVFSTNRLNNITRLNMSTAKTEDPINKPILALPSTADETVSFNINDTYKLKELGPVGKSLFFHLLLLIKRL